MLIKLKGLQMSKKLIDFLCSDGFESLDTFTTNMPINANILITGSSGVIGLNLVSLLLSSLKKHNRSDISLYCHYNKSKSFLESIFLTNVNLVNFDLSTGYFNTKFQAIFHFATYGQPGKFTKNSLDTLQLGSTAIINLRSMLVENGIFYFASSSEVYFGNPNTPHSESEYGQNGINDLRTPYIESKRFGESLCICYSNNGERFYSGRIALAYGPGAKKDDERVLNQFIMNSLSSNLIQMLDSGNAIRQYCFVEDTIDMILRQINIDYRFPINICGNSFLSIFELASFIGGVINVPVLKGDDSNTLSTAPKSVLSSMELINSKLNKTEFTPIIKGLTKTVEWYKEISE